jgi:cob(I)alamin adenosyltransferase
MFLIYTGEGRGKTTASLGLLIRSKGAGLNCYLVKFLKPKISSEDKILRKLKIITKRFGINHFILGAPNFKDKEEAKKAIAYVNNIIKTKKIGLLVLDEINLAIHYNLISINDAKEIIKECKRKEIELVFTGRCANKELIKIADLVSEIKEIKHYYNKGIKSRIGFEY